jgi:3-deoxy-D-manno-octulosonate 8-phosphate phosphatase (KDO 8-P phosphatase)
MHHAKTIELLLLDVDGVLTDGRITYTGSGDDIKNFHVRDGSGLKMWMSLGKKVAILSGRTSETVSRRAKELGIATVKQGHPDKLPAVRAILAELGLTPERACAMGDDLPDLPVFRHCGMGIAVADACDELKQEAAFVTKAPGGAGAVREAIEWLLKQSGQWPDVVEGFLATPTP